jgi:hypothetical protein
VFDLGGSPPGGWEGAGRPKEGGKYGKDSGARGRDPLGAHDKKKQYNPGLALAHFDGLKKNMKKFSQKDYQLINEAETIKNEYKKLLCFSVFKFFFIFIFNRLSFIY